MKLKLYARDFCYWSQRVIDKLDALELSYDIEYVGFISQGGREEIKRLTGQERVPVLIDDGMVIYPSRRILEHLECKYARSRKHGPRLKPTE